MINCFGVPICGYLNFPADCAINGSVYIFEDGTVTLLEIL